MIVERFRPEHLERFLLQPAQEFMRPIMAKPGYAQALMLGEAFACVREARVVACAGVLPLWEGRGEAWALIARDIGACGMVAVHWAARRYLLQSPLRRIESSCDAAFLQAHRWMQLLGFTYEGPLAKYQPDGRDALRFARVR